MIIAVASVLLIAVVLILALLSLDTLKRFSVQDSLLELEPLKDDDSSEVC